MRNGTLGVAAGVMVLAAGMASASVFNLGADWSDAANPNGAWTYAFGGTALTHITPSSPNSINVAVGNGYWGVSDSRQYNTALIKVTQDGSATSPYTNNDFLLGDVIAHSTNPGSGGAIEVIWTAPEMCMIDVTGSTWYAHSPVNRGNAYSLLVSNPVMGECVWDTGSILPANTRANRIDIASGMQQLEAGDKVIFRLVPSAGQQFGSLAGIDLSIDYTPIPTPSGLAVLGGMGLMAARRRR